MWPAVVSPRNLGIAAVITGLGLAVSAGVASKEQTIHGRVEKMGAGTVQSFVTLRPRRGSDCHRRDHVSRRARAAAPGAELGQPLLRPERRRAAHRPRMHR